MIADLGFEVLDIAAVPLVFEHILAVDPPHDQPEQFASLVDELDVEVNGVPTVVWLPDKSDDLEELRRRCTAVADVAEAVGARTWIVDAGQPIPDWQTGLERYEQVLAMQIEIARQRDLRLAIEAPHKGTLAERFEEISDVVGAAERAGIRDVHLDFDTSHIYNCGAPSEKVIAAYGDRIAHVAIRDSVGPGEWGMPVGEGNVDFAEVIGQLRHAGFDGDLTLELEPARETPIEERVRMVVEARDHLSEFI